MREDETTDEPPPEPPSTITPKPTPTDSDTKSKVRSSRTAISGLDQIGAMVDKERNKTKARSPLGPDTMMAAWEAYLEDISSSYIQDMLRRSKLELVDGDVRVTVDHAQVEETMTKQYNWIKYIRQYFGQFDINVHFIIEEDPERARKRKPITNREKFDFMVEKNEHLLDLIQRFKLKFDN